MIVAFLQFKVKNVDSIKNIKPNLGKLFIEFLNFYMNFEYTTTEINPLKPNDLNVTSEPFQKLTQQFIEFNSCMYIKDPLNPSNNVSRSAHKFYFMRVS
jgi:DNA polymerase sigma